MSEKIRVTVWNEYRHEKRFEEIRKVYPQGIHGAIAGYLRDEPDMTVGTATLDEPEHGLSAEVLEKTDVLLWWGHMAHGEVSDEVVERVYQRVLKGMGLIVLHSAHASKIFGRLCGTNTGRLRWREAGEKERLWNIEPGHPITRGIGDYIELGSEEMYGERFEIPAPEELVFISWFEGGEVCRSGCCYRRGNGRIFYFRPGHEAYPTYFDPQIRKVLANAIRWAYPGAFEEYVSGNTPPLEALKAGESVSNPLLHGFRREDDHEG
jgi:trehalose utilization protein